MIYIFWGLSKEWIEFEEVPTEDDALQNYIEDVQARTDDSKLNTIASRKSKDFNDSDSSGSSLNNGNNRNSQLLNTAYARNIMEGDCT